MFIDYLQSDLGLLKIEASKTHLTAISFVSDQDHTPQTNTITTLTKTQLTEYLEGNRQNFELPIDFDQKTEFFAKVWRALTKIPYGRTATYLDLANQLGDPKATRAVGMANGKNPIAIVVPCHRVIGSNGSLTGYAYGTDTKRQLLALENPRQFSMNGSLF